MRAGKGNLFVGFHCKLPRRGGSAVHRRVDWKQEKEFFFCMSNAGMLLKTKDRCGKGWAEAGMLLIAKEISSESGNVIENKEDRRFLKAVTRTCCRPLRPPLTGPCRPSNTIFGSVILSAAERSEESRSGLFRRQTAGRDASPAGRDQHDSEPARSRTS